MRDFSKQTAHIENWSKVLLNQGCYVLTGLISNHPSQKYFKGGGFQYTSNLLNFDADAKTAETRNTFYTLGEPSRDGPKL